MVVLVNQITSNANGQPLLLHAIPDQSIAVQKVYLQIGHAVQRVFSCLVVFFLSRTKFFWKVLALHTNLSEIRT